MTLTWRCGWRTGAPIKVRPCVPPFPSSSSSSSRFGAAFPPARFRFLPFPQLRPAGRQLSSAPRAPRPVRSYSFLRAMIDCSPLGAGRGRAACLFDRAARNRARAHRARRSIDDRSLPVSWQAVELGRCSHGLAPRAPMPIDWARISLQRAISPGPSGEQFVGSF